ncbi:MAG: DNA modification methylase, partial [candidate division WOR-3 bacterium]|nr:DNA modification methylase [candidate division WOR-3 bacterium]
MKLSDLIALYERKKQIYGEKTYQHISEILKEAKEKHKENWLKKPTKTGDHEQSWRAWKGKNLEKLIYYIIEKEVE